ncbi:hypothetical protein ACFZB9_04600 [Kitasatospora sp. NPDC008050]
MNETTTPPPEWCEGTDLDNFVLLLNGLKESLDQDLRDGPRPVAAGDR